MSGGKQAEASSVLVDARGDSEDASRRVDSTESDAFLQARRPVVASRRAVRQSAIVTDRIRIRCGRRFSRWGPAISPARVIGARREPLGSDRISRADLFGLAGVSRARSRSDYAAVRPVRWHVGLTVGVMRARWCARAEEASISSGYSRLRASSCGRDPYHERVVRSRSGPATKQRFA